MLNIFFIKKPFFLKKFMFYLFFNFLVDSLFWLLSINNVQRLRLRSRDYPPCYHQRFLTKRFNSWILEIQYNFYFQNYIVSTGRLYRDTIILYKYIQTRYCYYIYEPISTITEFWKNFIKISLSDLNVSDTIFIWMLVFGFSLLLNLENVYSLICLEMKKLKKWI